MQIRKIEICMAALVSCTAIAQAKAAETFTTTTTTTSRTATVGEPTTIVSATAPDSVVYFYTAPRTVLVTTIETRRKELEKAIDQAHARGEISGEQCEVMKQELRRIAQQTGSDTISYPAALMLAQDLDVIGMRYGTVVTNVPAYVPIITGSRFTISSGQTYQLDDLSARRIGLEAKITKDLFEGRLSAARAAELRDELSRIGTEANLYTANGTFDAKESRRLYDAFDHVASQIEKSAGKDKDKD